jgi:hypothetical protein
VPYANGTSKKEIVAHEMHKFKAGTLKSSSGQAVKDRKQSIAIALSEAQRYASKKGR